MYNRQLDTFLITAETGSFAAAAERLFISSSAINQQITALEESLDVKLFNRTNRGLSLTPAGEILKKELPGFISHADHLIKLMRKANEYALAPITVGIPLMHNMALFYDYWVSFSINNPAVSVKFESSESWKSSDAYSFYAACDIVEYVDLGSEWMKDRDFICVSEVPASLAVPVTHPLANKESIDIHDLSGYDIVVPGKSFRRVIQKELDRVKAENGIIHYEYSNAPEMMQYCLLNNYITIVTGIEPKISSRFKIIPCSWGIMLPYGFSVKRDHSIAVQKFIDFVQEEQKKSDNID